MKYLRGLIPGKYSYLLIWEDDGGGEEKEEVSLGVGEEWLEALEESPTQTVFMDASGTMSWGEGGGHWRWNERRTALWYNQRRSFVERRPPTRPPQRPNSGNTPRIPKRTTR